jgi:hypothetical protein
MRISQNPENSSQLRAPSYGFAPQSAGSVMIEIQHLDRDHALTRMGLHGHTFFELIYFERGGGAHALGGVRSPVQPGSLFVVCPGELHDCSAIGRAEGWVLLFTRAALEQSPESLAFSQEWLPRHPLFDPFLSLAIRSRNPFLIAKQDRSRWSQLLMALDVELRDKAAHYRHASRAPSGFSSQTTKAMASFSGKGTSAMNMPATAMSA